MLQTPPLDSKRTLIEKLTALHGRTGTFVTAQLDLEMGS